jgi:tetratricopeptide (TPR) repeat protein
MDSRKWYWQRNGQKVGPLSSDQLRQLAAKGKLQPHDTVLQEGSRQSVPAGSVKGLFKPSGSESRPLWPWMIAGCTVAALLGGGIMAVMMNQGKKEDESPQVSAVKPGDAEEKVDDKAKKPEEKKPEEKKPEEKKPEEKKPEEKKPDDKDKKSEVKPVVDTAEKLRADELARFLKAGKVFQDAKQYDAAIDVYTSAIKLNPESAEAVAGLKAAKDARTADLAQDQARREEEQNKRSFRLFMDNGQANLKRKQYDLAILAFTEAIKIKPDDEDAKAALLAAEKAQKAAVAVANPVAPPPRPMKNPNIDAYKQRMAEGRNALYITGDLDAAVMAFNEALKLFPDDLVAAAFVAEAQRVRNTAAALQIAQAQLIQREVYRGVDAAAALTQGRFALANGNLASAAQAFNYAFLLAPNDPAVIQARLDLQAAQNQVLAQQGYQQFLQNGRQALRDKRYNDAVNAYTQALNIAPFDQATQDLLREAKRLRAEARAAANTTQQTAAQVQQFLTAGRAALARNDLNSASTSFTSAQQLAPNDPGVIQALQDLTTARNTAQATGDRQKLLTTYQQFMKAGQDAQNAGRFQEAVRQFADAARQVRGIADLGSQFQDAENARVNAEKLKAQAAQTQDDMKRTARVRELLRNGRNALSSFHFDTAGKAFADAKNLAANDPEVQKALQDQDQARAQALKFDLHIDPMQLKLIPGTRGQLKVTVDRKGKDGFQGPIDVDLKNLPLGVSTMRETIPAGQNSVLLPLSSFPTTAIGIKNDVLVEARVRGINGSVKSVTFAIISAKK